MTTDGHLQTWTGNASTVQTGGWKFTPNRKIFLFSANKDNICTATRLRILLSGSAISDLIATATFVGNDATFSPMVTLNSGTEYRIIADDNGNSFTRVTVAPSLPISRPDFSIRKGAGSAGVDDAVVYNIATISYLFPEPASAVAVGTGTVGTRFVDTEYPYEEGLTLGTTKRSDDSPSLEPETSLLEQSWGSL